MQVIFNIFQNKLILQLTLSLRQQLYCQNIHNCSIFYVNSSILQNFNRDLQQINKMSKHSKNNNSSTIFTYGQRKKLKNVYGTIQTRVSQDSIKKFEMCTLCTGRMIQPTTCDQGHMFCRSCIIQYLVRQKKKFASQREQYEKSIQRQIAQKKQKELEHQVKRLEQFEKYDNFIQITDRQKIIKGQIQQKIPEVTKDDIKPIGVYELNPDKDRFLKSSFWTVENTPQFTEKPKKQQEKTKCPGSDHPISLRKLRNVICKELQTEFGCWICSKQINRQRIGVYKCGHLICFDCRSDKCEMCQVKDGWLEIERSHSSFAEHKKAQVKVYTHAFMS